MNESDPDVWARLLEGDSHALGVLHERYAPRLFRHASRLLSVREDAKDAVMIAFFELWRRRSSVRLVDGSPLPWLFVTVTNAARNLERSERRYRKLLGRVEPRAESRVPTPADGDSRVAVALRTLTERERSVFVLTEIEGYSERETAEALAIPVGTVKSRLARAKERLRGQLGRLEEAHP